jgi:lipoprotein-releasing system ATP-binding protein
LLGALDTPDGGQVRLDGHDLFRLTPAELARVRNRAIRFIFQFHYLLGDFDAERT